MRNAYPWLLLAAIMAAPACARSVEPSDGNSDEDAGDSEAVDSETPGADADGSLPCEAGEILCDGACVDTSVSHEHCGACSNPCPAEQVCFDSACLLECPSGREICEGTCVETGTDVLNCGACGHACPTGPNSDASCVGGECTLTCHDGYVDLDGAPGCECRVRREECNGRDDNCNNEIDETDDCPDDYRCIDGECQLYCNPPDIRPVDGRCLPSCGVAGGNWCPPSVCAPLDDPVTNNCCPMGSLIETWDCREGDDRPDNNYCCVI